jgi:hypothetical protein
VRTLSAGRSGGKGDGGCVGQGCFGHQTARSQVGVLVVRMSGRVFFPKSA